jgi:integrase
MPRLVSSVPKYRKHKQSGQAIVTLSGKDYLLGPYGTKASRLEYDRLVAEWLVRHRQPPATTGDGIAVKELAARYWTYAKVKYLRNGQPTPYRFKVKTAIKHLLRLYAGHFAEDFTPTQLKVVRQSMIDGGWSRKYVNQQVDVLVRMFKWGVAESLIPAAVYAALDLVDGLRRGESGARETSKRRGIDDKVVDATLPYLSPTLRAMIELQRATGARPGEICILRPMDLDRTGRVWEFRPAEHKGAHRDQERTIFIGPKAQRVLKPYLLRASDAYCFSAKESAEWHRAKRNAARKTPESCGNVIGSNRKRRPRRVPGDKFNVASYRRAIQRACDLAFPAPDDIRADAKSLAKWQKDHRWSPHQLRHAAATRIRRDFDIESAKAVLGHSATNTTGIYAEVDRQRAVAVARKIG